MIPPDSTADYLLLLVEPFWQICGAILLSILPAWGLARRIPVDPLTRLLVAALGSYTLMYLLEFGAYLTSAPQLIPLALLLVASIGSVVFTIRQEIQESDPAAFPWDGVITWGVLAVWILGMQSRVVVYGGAGWFLDWYGHYKGTVFFLDQLSLSTKIQDEMGIWTLAYRGPVFNASAALLMTLFGRDFWIYQTLATALNTFPVVALALLIRDMGRLPQRSALLWSAIILGIAPFAVQQEMYTWTKFFTIGFILGGIHLYRLGLMRDRPWLVGVSFGALAAGILAHYLVVPFALFFILHYVYSVLRRRWSWRVVGYQALACSALLATWFGFLIMTFGFQATLTVNPTLSQYANRAAGVKGPPPLGEMFVYNLVTTSLPYSWRHELAGVGRAPRIVQADPRAPERFQPSPSELNRKSEWFEDLARNPGSLPGALGWAGGIALLTSVALSLRRWRADEARPKVEAPSPDDGRRPEPGWIFWLIFFLVGIPLNVLMNPDHQHNGVAHANLQPFICLTAVLLLRWLQGAPKTVKVFLFGLFLIESALTTGALLALQGRQLPLALQGGSDFAVLGNLNADPTYVSNYKYKLREHAIFLSDRLGDLAGPFSLISAVIPIGLLIGTLKRTPCVGSVLSGRQSAPT